MRLTRRDGLATLAVVAAVTVYILWLGGTAFAGMSVRAIGGIVFALGWVACASDGAEMTSVYKVDAHGLASVTFATAATAAGIVALVAGVVTLVGANEVMLATLVAAMVVLWAMATVRHALPNRMHDPMPIGEPLDEAA